MTLPHDRRFALPRPFGPTPIWRAPGQTYRVHSHLLPSESPLSLTRLRALPTFTPRYRPPILLHIPSLGRPFITLIEPLSHAPTLLAWLESLRLSPREYDVITLWLQGFSIEKIAGRCILKEATVKEYLENVYRKANVRNGHEFMALALRKGTTPPLC